MAQVAYSPQPMDVSQTNTEQIVQTAEQKYYKVLHTDLTHKGFKYALGLNVDHLPFNPSGTCEPGGLYYTTAEYIPAFLSYGTLVAEVEPKGQIYADPKNDTVKYPDDKPKKWKTDKLFIHSIRSIKEWLSAQNESVQLSAVKGNAFNIERIENPSEAVQLAAVLRYGDSLHCITNPTYTVQLAAVKTSGHAIKYVKAPTEELKLAAVQQNAHAIRHIDNPSNEIKLAAVNKDSWCIEFIKDPTEEMQLIAVNKSYNLFRYIENPTELVLQTAKRLIQEDIKSRHTQSVVSMYVG